MMAEELATLFFNHWYCKNGCPMEIISDRDKLFISKFWKALMKLMGINHKMSMVYHPQTNGASERSNKTVIQALCFHVEWNQKGWVKALPRVRFHFINTVNVSTGFSPFVLKTGWSPHLISPLITIASENDNITDEDTAN
jgi:transposase InsO family protein